MSECHYNWRSLNIMNIMDIMDIMSAVSACVVLCPLVRPLGEQNTAKTQTAHCPTQHSQHQLLPPAGDQWAARIWCGGGEMLDQPDLSLVSGEARLRH